MLLMFLLLRLLLMLRRRNISNIRISSIQIGLRLKLLNIPTNIDRDVKKYPPKGQPLVSHLWKGIKSVVKQRKEVTGEKYNFNLDIWLEIVDNESGLKPRGFGIIYGGKFG